VAHDQGFYEVVVQSTHTAEGKAFARILFGKELEAA